MKIESIISAVIILSPMSSFASELNMKKDVNYNGGDPRGNICSIKLIKTAGNKSLVYVLPSGRSNFSGSYREFIVTQISEDLYVGQGCIQRYNNNTIIEKHPDETLEIKLHADGTPRAYYLEAKVKRASTFCDGLLDAPY